MRKDLSGAVEDFSVATDVEPRYADGWKRRGQARSALGDTEGALQDLQKAADLMPLWGGGADTSTSRAECLVEKGMIHHKARDFRRACSELAQAVKLDPLNTQAWNVLGLCSVSQGNIREGVAAYQRALDLNPKLKETWLNLAQALKEEGRVAESEAAFEKLLELDPPEAPNVHALKIMAQMKQQAGNHTGGAADLEQGHCGAEGRRGEFLAASAPPMIDLLYIRAICYHAMGYMKEAVRDYEDCLAWSRATNMTEETRAFQYLSFYQKDLALYLYKNYDTPASSFCPDVDISPLFKELWCKKAPPTAELITNYDPQPPMADQLGLLLQNHHQGFLCNTRQQRAAGFAAIELAQAVEKLVASRRAGQEVWVPNVGSSSPDASATRHTAGWRDAFDGVVKWRQLAEPNDQVIWVDLLTRREFEQGFGSHTPIFTGQTKCVRYFMNFKRASALHRSILLREGHSFDAQNRIVALDSSSQQEAIGAAQTPEDMYLVIQQDSWVVVPIASVSRPTHTMEGTRLTLVKVPNQADAYEFSIRTPVTPLRWRDFDVELAAAWEAVICAIADEAAPPVIAEAILTLGYYWYNFMPLARGTAAVGYASILALFWAAGHPITAAIPKTFQVDWQAILSQSPADFIAALSPWMLPPECRRGAPPPARGSPDVAPSLPPVFPPVSALPSVGSVLVTIRNRLEALNGEGARRV
ncbi:MAG: hypothetical protein WDW38_006026 [Sanguina aurantia]